MAVGDILETVLTTENVINKDKYVNVLHWIVNTDAAGVSNELDCGKALNLLWVTNIAPYISDKANLRQTLCQRVFPLPRTAGHFEDNGLLVVGAQTFDPLPPACALVVRKRTALAGRKYRGRLFQPMLTESDQSNGLFLGANYVNLGIEWSSILTTLLVGANGGEYSPVLWPKTGSSSADANLITSINTDNVVRQQRRREVNVGS